MNPPVLPLGQTTLRVPPLGIGTWAWGDKMFWGYEQGYHEADIRAAFDACLQAGIGFFDTAEVYGLGKSETLLGKFLAQGNRRAVVASKFFPFPHRLGKGSLLRALRGSLRRLGLDRIDLYQIHGPLPPVPIPVWMDALADAVQSGLILAAGVSNYDARRTRAAYEALARRGIPLASNQIAYSLLERAPERSGLISLCRERGIAVIAYSPLMQGILSGRYSAQDPPSGFRRFRFPREYLLRVQPLLFAMREIGQAHGGASLTQVALNWGIGKGAIPIPGVKNRRQAEDVIGALRWRLEPEEIARLDSAGEAAAKR
ncbi:MAG: aldo/keto reductase [Anaerolineales bacterium]|nr:aldo/keto reductase [Anaerolineales bacterium]